MLGWSPRIREERKAGMIQIDVIAPKKGELEKQVWEAIRKQVEEKLRDVKCPEHGRRPKVTISGSHSSPEFKIGGCCQKLIDEATKALQ